MIGVSFAQPLVGLVTFPMKRIVAVDSSMIAQRNGRFALNSGGGGLVGMFGAATATVIIVVAAAASVPFSLTWQGLHYVM